MNRMWSIGTQGKKLKREANFIFIIDTLYAKEAA